MAPDISLATPCSVLPGLPSSVSLAENIGVEVVLALPGLLLGVR